MKITEITDLFGKGSDIGKIYNPGVDPELQAAAAARAGKNVPARPTVDADAQREWDETYGALFNTNGTPKNKDSQSSEPLVDLASLKNMDRARAAVEKFLGAGITDEDMNSLIRTVASEASPNAAERAAVAAVILNRIRSNRYPNNMASVLTQKNQFQAVTGTKYDPGPSSNYTNMSDRTGAQVVGALIRYLPRMNKSWLNFTSNIPAAYGRGTNIDFMYSMRKSPGAKVIGKTVFGTV